MITDGKALAEEIKNNLKKESRGKNLRLDVVWVGDNAVSEKYVERKKKIGEEIGIEVVVHELIADITEEDLISEIEKLNNDERVNGIIVQLPLPKQLDESKILNLVAPEKDVDALSHEAKVLSPTVGAIKEILERNNVDFRNKKIVVLGKGKLVGRPVAIWLTQEGGEVVVIDSKTSDTDSLKFLQTADIIVSGVGQPGLIKPASIKMGVILIDAGTSESEGQLKGDADPACAEKCSLFTSVPGGVGPLTVVMLFKNLLSLSEVEP
ncbi:MAG: bifunctional 5,10-methylenetetrahydrofolate dehydrogenase/5,10-methenyltetrahydrofolate cyclohydrolase [Candidatus Paceibacterota bacterium]|jgi:methylenetetrahydrofolate dehydrogenase (NADP+)/methenyltetrahydrofolate cyclohydrolase